MGTGGTRLPAKARTDINERKTERDCRGEDVSLMVHSRDHDDGGDAHGDHHGHDRSFQVWRKMNRGR